MAGTKLNNFSTVDVNLTAIMSTLTALYKGLFKLSLTDFDTDVRPQVAVGSVIDLNGSLYLFDEDTAGTVTPDDGIVYMKIVPSGSTASVVFTSVAPSWSDEKQGWYFPLSSHRYIAKMIKSGTAYSQKILYDKQDIAKIRETLINTVDESGTNTLTHVLTFSFDIGAIVNFALDQCSNKANEYIYSFTITDNVLTIVRKLNYSTYSVFGATWKYFAIVTVEEI